MQERDPRARPFDLGGGPDAVLCLHGLTGTPAEMRPLAECVNQTLGWRCVAPLLPGHGTNVEDLRRRRWTQWLDAAHEAHAGLRRAHGRVHLAGLSMGALLAVELWRTHARDAASLVLMAPALWLRGARRLASVAFQCPWIASLVRNIAKGPAEDGRVDYPAYPTAALGELGRLGERVRTLAPGDAPATLVAFSHNDPTVAPRSAIFLAARLRHPRTRLVALHAPGHVLTQGADAARLFAEIEAFYRSLAPDSR